MSEFHLHHTSPEEQVELLEGILKLPDELNFVQALNMRTVRKVIDNAIRADRAKLMAIFRKDSVCNCELTKRLLGESAICFIHTFENVIRDTPIGDGE